MKKKYSRPEIKKVLFMSERIALTTDTTGNLTFGNNFGARRDTYIEDEEDEEAVTQRVWFSD